MFCIPIIAKDTNEALSTIGRANHAAGIVEIRLDTIDTFDLEGLIQAVGSTRRARWSYDPGSNSGA